MIMTTLMTTDEMQSFAVLGPFAHPTDHLHLGELRGRIDESTPGDLDRAVVLRARIV